MITLNQIKFFLAINPNEASKDTLLEGFIADSVSELNALTRRMLDFRQHVEISDGIGGITITLDNYPVSEVTLIEVLNGNNWVNIFNPPDNITDSAIVIKEYGFVKLLKSYLFPKGERNVRVTYKAGYKGADKWRAGVSYAVKDMARYNDSIYKCITAHTSGAEFDESKWDLDPAKAVPESLANAVLKLTAKQFYESPAGKNIFMKSSESITQKQTDYKDIDISAVVNNYRNTNI